MLTQNVVFRIFIIAICAAGGFLFPLLFFVSAFVAWALFSDLTAPEQPDADAWHRKRWTATADDPDWKSYFLPVCESPAEIAFLEAMIAFHSLVPNKGDLNGAGLSLTLQAKLPPYRVDFLVDNWLVVEIDGATYHSSPEAVARDHERDQALQDRGFRVVRIPAKVVFVAPSESVKNVADALALGKPVRTATKARPKLAAGQLFATINKTVANLNRQVAIADAVQAATSKSRITFETEMTAVESALESAAIRRDISARRAQSEDFARSYDQAWAQISALFEENEPAAKLTVPKITEPPPHQDPAIDTEVRRAHQSLMDERSSYFESVRHRIVIDGNLGELVKEALDQIGYPEGWHHISNCELRS